MPQFDVHWLNDGYVVDCQSDLIDTFASRLVIPLLPAAGAPRALERLTPTFEIRGEPHILATPLAAGVQRRELGEPLFSLSRHEYEIKSALDLLITGV